MCGITFQYPINHQRVDGSLIQTLWHRGPDATELHYSNDKSLCVFNRLAIIDSRPISNQPFKTKHTISMCNGEIYNWKKLVEQYSLETKTTSDCEVVSLLYNKINIIKVCQELSGEFAFILFDHDRHVVFFARDPYGVRPLFYRVEDGILSVSSEAKAFDRMKPVQPGLVYSYSNAVLHRDRYHHDLASLPRCITTNIPDQSFQQDIRKLVTNAVVDRITYSDRPIGCFLSGGLDSSLVTALAYQHNKNIECFSIGLEGSRDVAAAKKVAHHLGIKHHTVTFTVKEGFQAIRDVIKHLETYDVTTIRASVPQYLLSKYIKEHTPIRVLLSGEGADEVFAGYQYSKLTTSNSELELDGKRLLEELYLFDNLRTDRTTAAWGLEVRTPFLDKELVRYVFNELPSSLKMCNDKIEKHVLRSAFDKLDILPHDILWRPKDAFSDAVSSEKESWYEGIQQELCKLVKPRDLLTRTPLDVEKQYYKSLYNSLFPHQPHLFSHYWRPRWTSVEDPSATKLHCYA